MPTSKKILVVDDHVLIRKLILMAFEDTEYEILQARNGQSALELANAEQPDLILLDVMMPDGMDGLEVCRELRRDEHFKETPIIMLSAKAQLVNQQEGLKAGANLYLMKPFSPNDLVTIVSKYLA